MLKTPLTIEAEVNGERLELRPISKPGAVLAWAREATRRGQHSMKREKALVPEWYRKRRERQDLLALLELGIENMPQRHLAALKRQSTEQLLGLFMILAKVIFAHGKRLERQAT